MFFYTDTADAPWTIVKSDDKKRARLELHAALPLPRWIIRSKNKSRRAPGQIR
jgi:polyphosphate kinase 2 (PPK2 family)